MSQALKEHSPKTKGTTLADQKVPQFIEATADGTALGKSFTIERLRYHYERHGIKTTIVRIESRGVAHRPLRESDIFIPTEEFAQSKRRIGGLAGVLQPLFAAIARAAQNETAVLLDWAGGHAQNRLEVLTATAFDERLAELCVRGCSVTITSNVVARMREATDNLLKTAETAPGLTRKLLLNGHRGPFVFPADTTAHAAYRDLLTAAKGAVMRLPEIGGDAWPICEANSLSMLQVLRATPKELAELVNQDPFIAKAVINEIAAWWVTSEKEIKREFPLPKPSNKQR